MTFGKVRPLMVLDDAAAHEKTLGRVKNPDRHVDHPPGRSILASAQFRHRHSNLRCSQASGPYELCLWVHPGGNFSEYYADLDTIPEDELWSPEV